MAKCCVKCGAPRPQPTERDYADVFAVLEPAPSRADTPHLRVCRAALRDAYGSKRAQYLIDMALRPDMWHATRTSPQRRVLLHGKIPLRPKGYTERLGAPAEQSTDSSDQVG
jgi:hypothetical protein